MNAGVGEKKIVIGQNEYILRPSFRALNEIETQTGKGIIELFEAFRVGKTKASDVVAILYACIKAGWEPGKAMPTMDEIGEQAYEHGVMRLSGSAFEVIIEALSKGGNAETEKKT